MTKTVGRNGTLHVTNGDSAVEALRAAGFDGVFLPWRDVLHDGPVPPGLSAAELAAVRATFIADYGWDDLDHALRSFRERDSLLERLDTFKEVVLWFEHDLYDQLQLIQVLDRIAGTTARPSQLSATIEAAFISMLPADELRRLFAERRPVTQREFAPAIRAWSAFRASDPSDLAGLSEADLEALPFLHSAIDRLLEEFPAPGSGLSRTERQALDVVTAGSTTPARAFRANQAREEAMFMGDVSFWRRLQRLLGGARPLLAWADETPDDFPPRSPQQAHSLAHELVVTEDGQAVRAGSRDQITLNGIDRWIGGVRLTQDNVWRWDPESHTLSAP